MFLYSPNMISGSYDLFYFSANKFPPPNFFFLLHIFTYSVLIFKDNENLSFLIHLSNEILYL